SGPICMAQSDCPSDTDCATYVCSSGKCQVTLLPEGTEVQKGMGAGDCHRVVCTAGGTTTTQVDMNDPPPTQDPCNTKSCDGDGNTVSTVAPDDTMCASGLFCKKGICTGCVLASDCP